MERRPREETSWGKEVKIKKSEKGAIGGEERWSNRLDLKRVESGA